jgi:hypothetical protein
MVFLFEEFYSSKKLILEKILFHFLYFHNSAYTSAVTKTSIHLFGIYLVTH